MANQNLERIFRMKPYDVLRVSDRVIKYEPGGLSIGPYEGHCTAALDSGDSEIWRVMHFIARIGSYPADLKNVFGDRTPHLYVPQSWEPFIGFLKDEYPRGIDVKNSAPYLMEHAFKVSANEWRQVQDDGHVISVEVKGGLTEGKYFRQFIRRVPVGENIHDYPELFIGEFLRETYPDVTDVNHILDLSFGDTITLGTYVVKRKYRCLTAEHVSPGVDRSLSITTANTLEYLHDRKVSTGRLRTWLYEKKFFCINSTLAKQQH